MFVLQLVGLPALVFLIFQLVISDYVTLYIRHQKRGRNKVHFLHPLFAVAATSDTLVNNINRLVIIGNRK